MSLLSAQTLGWLPKAFKSERRKGKRYIDRGIKSGKERKRERRNSSLVFISVALSKPVN